ncbi:hypothetical protein B9Z55_013176 [Caenorhabditis nigoni]|uniref:Invertebrate defensins family profile domain-containing protein n=1 Tax=Caenorhabditis nigoni TaxID=1611254 RepID=A0A2G5U0F1_9PELO|nr:hypothetical protein B9Z55_013176 [Caenorhabditis nigoni]
MIFHNLLISLLVFTSLTVAIDLSSCARMDVPILKKAAHGLCITSCSMQNCGTGNCQKRKGRPTCICYRCAKGGGNIPLAAFVKG